MTLDEIFELWRTDSQIDETELGRESLNIPRLHHKYYRLLSNERMIYHKRRGEYGELKLEKTIFYTDGPSKEQVEKGWKLPPRGKILKNEVDKYLEADPDLITLKLKLSLQEEKVTVLEDIIKTLNNRGWQIKNALEWLKFTNGEN